MTRKTCTDHSYIDIVAKLCRELQLLHKSKFNKAWESSSVDFDAYFNLFLKENGITLEQIQPFLQMTRNKMPRTRAASMCYKIKHSPISPVAKFAHRLRTRRHTAYNNFVDTSGDDDSNHVRPMRELRSSSRISLNQLKQRDSSLWNSGRPKRMCIKQKRIPPDNRSSFKVEVTSNKLRRVRNRKIKSPVISEDSEDDKVYNLNKKYKRVSAITRLNNEAENFLFPNKDDSSTETETDVTDASSRKKLVVNHTKPNKICKNEPEEESSMDSISSESSVVKKKRRLTQAEAFILDNQTYYKFETPGSRLRYQGSYLSPLSSKNNGEYGVKHSRIKEIKKMQEKSKLQLDNLKFSFEIVPNGEPWYSTFQRQDKGEECYTCYNYFSGYKPFLLPYEMGPLPPLNPRVCYTVYDRMKKEIIGDTGPSTSEACSTPDISNVDTLKTDYNSTGEDTKSSEDVSMEAVLPEKVHRKSTRRKMVGGRNPRKSPRQHASTLAILSSLIHQRKRRDYNRHRTSDQSQSGKNNLSVIAEDKEHEPEPDYDELTKSIDDMLLNTYGDIKVEDGLMSDGVNVNVHCMPSAVGCLEEYSKTDVCNGARKEKLNNVLRKPNRKKKKNRTGWPNKNRRHIFRKEGSDSRDGIESASIKNNCVESEENSSDNNFIKRNKNKNSFSNKLSKVNKINGDVQVNKLNGEICFKNVGMPRRKEHRESSSDNCAEVVIPSVGDKIDCVNVDLAKWENAEKLLAAKIRYEDINNDILFQPIVRVQKLDCNIEEKCIEKHINVSTTKQRSRARRMPASPKSPRMLRRPRGGWYRDRY